MLTFSQALEAALQGKKIYRTGWNGKGMYIYYENEMEKTQGYGLSTETICKYEPCLILFNTQGKHQPGWVPSQKDMFAKDWAIIEEEG